MNSSAMPTSVPSTAAPSTQPTYYPSLSPHSISIITTIAGTGTASYSGDGGQATSATVNSADGIVIDTSWNVYFSDFSNCRVRKITSSTGIITTYAGSGSCTNSGDGGSASSAGVSNPMGLGLDASGNIYIAQEGSNSIRKVAASTAVITTVAGNGNSGYNGDNIQATSAYLTNPIGVAVDSDGNIYIGDQYNHRVRKVIVSSGVITTVAGSGSSGYSGNNGPATSANICRPCGVNLDRSNNIYFGEYDGYGVIRKVTVSTGILTTVAGTGTQGYNGDNIQATSALLNSPYDVVVDSYGNLYIADWSNNRVRKVTVNTGLITTVAGTGTASSTGDGSVATSATLNGPMFIRLDSSGNLYIGERTGNRVRKVITVSTDIPTATPTEVPSIRIITTIAGTGSNTYSGDNGQATAAALDDPYGVALDTAGKLPYF